MKKTSLLFCIIALFLLPLSALAEQKDATGCKDHPLFTKMPGYWIYSCVEKQFDVKTFTVAGGKKEDIEGRTWIYKYYPQANMKPVPSDIQLIRNMENAITKIGGKVLSTTNKTRETLLLSKDGKDLFIEIWAEFTGKYGFTIVERGAMAQDIVASAEVFSNDLKNSGHAAVYGILFDTAKSDIKPESAQAIGEIAKLLKADPSLKIFVVGHTDNVGTLDANMKLSQARAEAVVQALVKTHGVAAARLKSFGNGPYAPVAANDNESGRAKNRRVELVKQ